MSELKHTIACYEHPAARHLIDEWRAAEANRINEWRTLCHASNGLPLEVATMASGELVVIVPVHGVDIDQRHLEHALTVADWRPGHVGKMLYFGKMPPAAPNFTRLRSMYEGVREPSTTDAPVYGPVLKYIVMGTASRSVLVPLVFEMAFTHVYMARGAARVFVGRALHNAPITVKVFND